MAAWILLNFVKNSFSFTIFVTAWWAGSASSASITAYLGVTSPLLSQSLTDSSTVACWGNL